MPRSFKEDRSVHEKTFFCERRRGPADRRRRPPIAEHRNLHFVNFRKPQRGAPVRLEVVIVAPRKRAIREARQLVAPIKGLQYDGVD